MTSDELYLAYLERHRRFVYEECGKLGVAYRGKTHDLSKYDAEEYVAYREFFYGGHERGQEPLEVRQDFDRAWLLHQKKNDHHWQHWLLALDDGGWRCLEMPEDAMLEMVADWRGAGRAVLGDAYTETTTRDWYLKNVDNIQLHPHTRLDVEALLGVQREPLTRTPAGDGILARTIVVTATVVSA